MADIGAIGSQLRAMPVGKLVAVLVVIAVTIASLVLLFAWMQKADLQLLYANLSEEDAGAIIQKLNELKVPYKATAGGVMVPADRVYDLRLQLASQGLPQGGGIGFEVFDKTSFAMTDFVQKLNYRRALQGELSRTIRSMGEVEQCRVHLAVPEKTLFVKEGDRPKASVLVKLRQGRRLSQPQVQGIVHLVASSVEGLDSKDVAVVDNRGEMLTSASGEAMGMTSGQLEYQRALEKDLESRIVGILEPVVGKNRVKAKVAAAVDFTKVEKTEERFDPDSQVIRSEQRATEKALSGSTGGVPGVASNLPAKTAPAAGGSQGQSEKKNETVNYEISRITSRSINALGEVKRISVVALVDGVYAAAEAGKDAKEAKEKKYSPRAEEELKKFEDMVKNAVGFTAARGDEVRVVNMQFEGAAPEDLAEAKRDFLPIILTVGKYLVPIVVVALLFILVIKPLLNVLATPSAPPARAGLALPQSVAEIERALEIGDTSARDRLIDWAKKNPKDAADLVKSWIAER